LAMGDKEPRWLDKDGDRLMRRLFLEKIEGLDAMTHAFGGCPSETVWDSQQLTYIIEKLEAIIGRLQTLHAEFVETTLEGQSTPTDNDMDADKGEV
jgi:hypothetical protein